MFPILVTTIIYGKTKVQQLVKQNCFIANETGMCRLVLWEEPIGSIKKGQTYMYHVQQDVGQTVQLSELPVETEESVIEDADDIG